MSTLTKIKNLIKRFEEQIDTYKQSDYNETQTRIEFINPFFTALGWDVENKQGLSITHCPVIHEDILKIDKAPYKRPDYSFRVGGVRKFFVEAKKPSINLKKNPEPAYQLRRYGWNAKLSLSIITNFAEFAVYDCRLKPEKDDAPSVGRVLYLKYTDYLESWEELVKWFSFEAVWQGKFDQYAAEKAITKGAIEVDTAFLNEMERWREKLAHHIFAKNPILTQRQLNFVVQQTIDRIVFLRICEDRGIEDYGRLLSLTNGKNSYKRLFELFIDADARYNSGLFHFKKEKEREQPDKLTPHLKIGDDVLQEIIISLYYPKSPYEFSVLPADILGQVYERFLGKIIRLTNKHEAIIEEKPEVKKAGGVYYTPSYIVDYIVKQTLTPLLKGKKVGHRSTVNRLKVLDPACGSGSFLLGAYQFLLDWHLQQYLQNPKKWTKGKNPRLYQAIGKTWKLTVEERKRILLNNIYGVDIDFQAVEVTKLSLLLKVLEDEQSVISQLSLLKERVLPDIDSNIKCGNSLIGDEFYQEKQLELIDEETQYRVNAFDWKNEFAEAMQAGGFDAIIGNPPYVRIQTLKEWIPLEVEFYKDQYIAARKGNYDIYVIFVEKGLSLLNDSGYLGFILPNKFLLTDYGEKLRQFISKREALVRLVDFGHEQVFEQATTYTCLLFLSSTHSPSFEYIKSEPSPKISKTSMGFVTYSSSSLSEKPWLMMANKETDLFAKLMQKAKPLLELPTTINRGSSSGNDDIFILKSSSAPNRYITKEGFEIELEPKILRYPLFATDFTRYQFMPKNEKLIIFPYTVKNNRFELISENELKNFPKAFQYLCSHKDILEHRAQYKSWYSFSAPRNLAAHDAAQLIVPLLANKGLFVLLPENQNSHCLMASGGFSITITNQSLFLPQYLLGLLNSKLLFWYLKSISNWFRGGWITCTKQYVGKLPIRIINFDNPSDKTNHDKIVQLVEQMLTLNKKRGADNDPQTQTVLERRIKTTDKQINQLVYTLYDLTAKEIEIVEKGD
ncbi:N-6 DNA methylase [Candidatus Parabeggiatoa sp. HSG14]|uniref:Eco57I restriction-modification methylase domain-containing protein n=1 Tax=Candidatus Parabeggiatoa sp. HSG14 TaxID=3055593 RepID=UPI0025A7F14D|nr:Eco57I restriction-modification methylase domain-containing protein [Thiotrichales bacterium HSG14]